MSETTPPTTRFRQPRHDRVKAIEFADFGLASNGATASLGDPMCPTNQAGELGLE